MNGQNTIFAKPFVHLVEGRVVVCVSKQKQVVCMTKDRQPNWWSGRIICWQPGHHVPGEDDEDKSQNDFKQHFVS